MRLRVASLILALAVAFTPPGSAGSLGHLDSKAPVELFGSAFAGGSNLSLFHHSFDAASFTGILYSGSIVDVERRSMDPCVEQGPYRETVRPLASVSASTPDPISFNLAKDSVAIVDFGNEARAPAGAGDPLNAEDPDGQPASLLGPNPYVIQARSPQVDYGPEFVRVFPLEPFLIIPTDGLNMPFTGKVVVEIGNLSITQGGRDRTFESATTYEPNQCLPNVPFQQPRPVYHRIEVRADTAVLTVQQGPLERTRAWYDGTLAAEPSNTPDRSGQAAACSGEPRGYVMRERPDEVQRVDHACALPATSYSSANLTAYVEGLAVFEDASGIVAAGYEDKQITAEPITLTGNLDLTPAAVEENGKRMRTDIDGAVFQVNSPDAPAPNDEWQAYAAGAAGGALLFGVFLYSWPMLKWRFAALAVPLYARLKKNEVLENPLRDDILAHVQETPGISASELGRRVECGWGTLVYHLTVLERMQLVSSAREGRHKRFFAQGRINYSDKGAVGLLANPAARTILDAIRGSPGTIQKDLSVRLNLSPGTVAWHVERLAAEGLVIKEDEGRTVRYYPSERLLQLTQRLAA